MGKNYDNIVIDEIRYLFDTLQDNSIYNIAKLTGVSKTKVAEVLDKKINKIERFN